METLAALPHRPKGCTLVADKTAAGVLEMPEDTLNVLNKAGPVSSW